jgi:hypothetical protein
MEKSVHFIPILLRRQLLSPNPIRAFFGRKIASESSKVDEEGHEKAEKRSPRKTASSIGSGDFYFYTLSALANKWWDAGFAATQHLF